MFYQELRKKALHLSQEGASLWGISVEPGAHRDPLWYDSHRRGFVLLQAELSLAMQSTAKEGHSAALPRRDLWSLYTG